ncbi:hypothetical protein ACE1CM_22725 [Microseira sp. BLCC-F43]
MVNNQDIAQIIVFNPALFNRIILEHHLTIVKSRKKNHFVVFYQKISGFVVQIFAQILDSFSDSTSSNRDLSPLWASNLGRTAN